MTDDFGTLIQHVRASLQRSLWAQRPRRTRRQRTRTPRNTAENNETSKTTRKQDKHTLTHTTDPKQGGQVHAKDASSACADYGKDSACACGLDWTCCLAPQWCFRSNWHGPMGPSSCIDIHRSSSGSNGENLRMCP